MICKLRDGYDVIHEDRFLCRNASYSDALKALRAAGVCERDAHILLQGDSTWLEYREAWLTAVNEAKQ